MSELRGRLEALLEEARAAGELAALSDLLLAAAREPWLAERTAGTFPGRFGLVGDSPAMHALYGLLERVAPTDVSVLIHGETGTGKELVARALHDHSARAKKPFLAENCAAVAETLLESELFGHVKGSFTGAVADRDGHFVAADGGTLFLDEIGDMPGSMQTKLLRVLETGEVRPVGSNKTRRVNVRVVAATHRDLARMVGEKTFREDLFFRLNVITLELPPLREREGDVRLLTEFFLTRVDTADGKAPELGDGVREALESYRWPGNVRQLENELRRAL